MEIIGTGFLARHLTPQMARHPRVTALAAGVSSTAACEPAAFAREERLVAEVARRCRASGRLLVFFSTASAAMYGGPGCTGREDSPAAPALPYGRHKLALERMVAASGTDHLILRLSHLMGPDQPAHHLLPALLEQARRGEFRVFRGATRDILDVRDAVRARDGLLAAGAAGEVVNVASGQQTPIEAVISHLEHRLGHVLGRCYVDAGPAAAAPVDIGQLRRLLPGLAAEVSAPGYVQAVIDRSTQGRRDWVTRVAP
jgi:NDP-hexose 4-ketoreductase